MPTPVTAHASSSVTLTPSFAISEQRVDQPRKFRLIGDFKASGANEALHLHDTCVPGALDYALLMARVFQNFPWGLNGRNLDLKAFSVDFAHAYEHIGVAPEHLPSTTIILRPPGSDVPHMATIHTQPFG